MEIAKPKKKKQRNEIKKTCIWNHDKIFRLKKKQNKNKNKTKHNTFETHMGWQKMKPKAGKK